VIVAPVWTNSSAKRCAALLKVLRLMMPLHSTSKVALAGTNGPLLNEFGMLV